MRKLLSGLGVVIPVLCTIASAYAQEATERYIPIGQSPGLSQKVTSMGEIATVDAQQRTITITEQAGSRTVRIEKDTRIWIDRTRLKLTNLTGGFADLRKGSRVEVKYADPARRDVADWVKVEAAQP